MIRDLQTFTEAQGGTAVFLYNQFQAMFPKEREGWPPISVEAKEAYDLEEDEALEEILTWCAAHGIGVERIQCDGSFLSWDGCLGFSVPFQPGEDRYENLRRFLGDDEVGNTRWAHLKFMACVTK